VARIKKERGESLIRDLFITIDKKGKGEELK
jgi:hypothetical protein